MARRMLIDATHDEETRVTVVNGNRLEEFDYETESKRQLKGNIYLAKVIRVEPSLQACFVDYGGNRHGFLAFPEIHPDYYRIPVSDRDDLVEEAQSDEEEEDTNDPDEAEQAENGASVEELGGDEGHDEAQEQSAKRRPRLKRQYKIQEVIKRRQVILVQVVKEERGNKGATLTTYLSLAGRYCVLMPNTSRGGGVSRKITNIPDRKRLKSAVAALKIPQGMAVIVRTAGAGRTKTEVKRDFEYITRLWDQIRSKTLAATAPSLIHEEANLIKRSIRDLYTKEIEEVLVAGDASYRTAKDFIKTLMPSHAKKVQPYKDDNGIPLFQRYQVESQLSAIHEPIVSLKAGGSIVMNQTEALVAIDVNSGRATKERHIEETALKTNLEAAEEIARQLRLRDMAGLIVIDFIDMDDNRNDAKVERKLKESLRKDRARIQVGRISPFGLLEMSRQRLRPSLLEAISQICPTCAGTGYVQSTDSAALNVLRSIEEEGLQRRTAFLTVTVNPDVAMYILNSKRTSLAEMEANYGYKVTISVDTKMLPTEFSLAREGELAGEALLKDAKTAQTDEETQEQEQTQTESRYGKRRRRGGRRDTDREQHQGDTDLEENEFSEDADSEQRKRRKRGRRGRRRRHRNEQEENLNRDAVSANDDMAQSDLTHEEEAQPDHSMGENNPDRTDRDRADRDRADRERPGGGRRKRTNRHPANRRNNRRAHRQNNPYEETAIDMEADDIKAGSVETGETKNGKKSDTNQPDAVAANISGDISKGVSIESTPQIMDEKPPVKDTEEIKSGESKPEAASEEKKSAPSRTNKTRESKTQESKTRTKKTSAKKATGKKTSAKKPRAKKASGRKTAGGDIKAPALKNSTPEAPQAETATKAGLETSGESSHPNPKGPKRKGWWSRVVGE